MKPFKEQTVKVVCKHEQKVDFEKPVKQMVSYRIKMGYSSVSRKQGNKCSID